MMAAVDDTRRVIQGRLLNWALWAILGNKVRLGYSLQSWQKLVKCGPGDETRRGEKDIDDDDADQVHRCYIYMRNEHPQEAQAGRVFYLDNYADVMSPGEMARLCTCSVATFYRRKQAFEYRMGRCLGEVPTDAVA